MHLEVAVEKQKRNRIVRKFMHRVTRGLKDERKFDPSECITWEDIQPFAREVLRWVLEEEGI